MKYEDVWLRAYETVSEARVDWPISGVLNGQLPHSSLGRCTPDEAYFGTPTIVAAE